ncbi:MAG: type IV secretion system DotC family protein [Chlorobi bacterium]|nr:type IV secretion system DotC family protein [Chlorobiota bacterium]
MKKTVSLILFSVLSFGFTLNVNLPRQMVLPVTGQDPKQNPVKQKTPPKTDVQEKKEEKTKYIVTDETKVVGNTDIDDLTLKDPALNICQAFVSENSSNAFDYGYLQGKAFTDLYIGGILVKYKKYMDILFPLKDLYVQGILEPPAVEKDKSEYTYDNGQAYRNYGVRYKVIKPARFVTSKTKKSWEDFILGNPDIGYYLKPVNFSNLNFKFSIKWSNDPVCNDKIYKAVVDNFKKGFKQGESETQMSYSLRLTKLQNYLNQLYLYNELYYRRVINPPVIGEFTTPVYKTEDGQTLVINENYYKIIKPAKFNTETKKWKVFLIGHNKIQEIR